MKILKSASAPQTTANLNKCVVSDVCAIIPKIEPSISISATQFNTEPFQKRNIHHYVEVLSVADKFENFLIFMQNLLSEHFKIKNIKMVAFVEGENIELFANFLTEKLQKPIDEFPVVKLPVGINRRAILKSFSRGILIVPSSDFKIQDLGG
jgi:hypothetical protein